VTHGGIRTVLITGAAGDIGAKAAAQFAKAGDNIVITDRRKDELDQVAGRLWGEGAAVLALAADQTRPDEVAGLFAEIERQFGRLDVAFINAGYGRYGELIDMPFELWQKHVSVNLNGGFLMSQGAARLMRDGGRGGVITFNASTAATYVCDLLGAYAASKAGVLMLARSLASELGVHRIRVNVVLPGVIETAMTRSLIDDPPVRSDALRNTPVGRLGKPEDIAATVFFLSSDSAGYITGAEILVDGGQTIHGYPRWFSADYALQGSAFSPHSAPPK
jgi:NAD(P)-dependent dehydrogenase (short-subunit alcohol dehydrogenase family)